MRAAFFGMAVLLASIARASPDPDGLIWTTEGVVAPADTAAGFPSVAAAYLGINYASPPTGESGRWQPPRPAVKRADGIIHHANSSTECFGKPTPGTSLSTMSENCLTLDVYTPQKRNSTDLAPVMVFLHGGSLVEGSSRSIQSGFHAIANATRMGVLSIGVNYRIGVLGFLSLEALAGRDARGHVAGNYGLLDVLQALRWVQSNAAAFGGDARRVTVYGQSSGGSLVLALFASPLAAGLFQSGISMSGSPRLSATWDEASSVHQAVVERTPCTDEEDQEKLRRCLLGLDAATVANAMPTTWDSAGFGLSVFSPAFRYDPVLVADGPLGAVPSGYLQSLGSSVHPDSPAASGATLVIGTTREESDFAPEDNVLFSTPRELAEMVWTAVNASLGDRVATEVVAAYGLREPAGQSGRRLQQLYAQVVSDATIFCPTLVLADAISEGNSTSPIYLYQTTAAPGRSGSKASDGFCESRVERARTKDETNRDLGVQVSCRPFSRSGVIAHISVFSACNV